MAVGSVEPWCIAFVDTGRVADEIVIGVEVRNVGRSTASHPWVRVGKRWRRDSDGSWGLIEVEPLELPWSGVTDARSPSIPAQQPLMAERGPSTV
jgi:hypothetical protein